MLDENLDNQPNAARPSSKLRSRRDLVARSLQILNSFLQSSAQMNATSKSMSASPQGGITRRQFAQSVVVTGAALAALPHIAISSSASETAGVAAVSEPMAVINFDTVRYLSAVIGNHSDIATKRLFAEKLMPDTKLVFSSGESEYVMNDCFARAARQGEDFVRQVLANVEDRFRYPGTDYVLDRELRYFCEKKQYQYWRSCTQFQRDHLPLLSEAQYTKMFRDVRNETIQFIRKGLECALQNVDKKVYEQEVFHPVNFAVDAGNIVIHWQPVKKLLSLSRPELPGLFPNYSITWPHTSDVLDVGPEESQSQQLVMRGQFMTQFAKLVHQAFPKTINRTLRSSSSGMLIKYPPKELLLTLGIKPDVSYHSETTSRPSGLQRSSNIHHVYV